MKKILIPEITIVRADGGYLFQIRAADKTKETESTVETVKKDIGELLIEVSEINVFETFDIIDRYENLDEAVTIESITEFSIWAYREFSLIFSSPIAFLMKNMFVSMMRSYSANSKKGFSVKMKEAAEDFYKKTAGTDESFREKIKPTAEAYEDNVGNFAKTAIMSVMSIIIVWKYVIRMFDSAAGDSDTETIEQLSAMAEIQYRITRSDKKFVETYSFRDIISLMIFDMCNAANEEVIIKKCSNCGGRFIPKKRSDALYCDRPSRQDGSMTCKEYGSRRLWYDRLKDNKSAKLYRNIYMAKQMMAKRYPDVQAHQDDFEEYKSEAAQWKKDVKEGLKTDEEYIKWLKSVSGRRYFD